MVISGGSPQVVNCIYEKEGWGWNQATALFGDGSSASVLEFQMRFLKVPQSISEPYSVWWCVCVLVMVSVCLT